MLGGEEITFVDIFIVDDQKRVVVHLKAGHAVIVVAKGLVLLSGGAAGGFVKGGSVRPEGITPFGDDLPVEAFWDGDSVKRVRGYGLEAKFICR